MHIYELTNVREWLQLAHAGGCTKLKYKKLSTLLSQQ